MATYSNYVIRQGDTLETIAQVQLNNALAWTSLIPINRLRYPYISDDIRDQYGTPHIELPLLTSIHAGDIYLNLKQYVDSGQIPESLLNNKSTFFIKKYDGNGNFVHDALIMDEYYPYTYAIKQSDNTYFSVSAGTIAFNVSRIENPTILSLNYMQKIAGGNLSNRTYYVKYTYVTHNGETMPSPDNIDPDSGARTGFLVEANNLLAFTAPENWPENTIGVNLYIGTNPEILFKQTNQQNGSASSTFTSEGQIYIEPTTGININTSIVPTSNSAKIGFKNSYEKGIVFSIHSDPKTFTTQVLKTGDIIHLEISRQQSSQLIINKNINTQFINTFGTDIKINEKGFLTFDSTEYPGDTATVTGLSNVRQAVRSRLLTKYGALSTRPKFGNTALTMIGERYRVGFLLKIRGAIQQTMLNESRIQSVENIVLQYDATTGACMISNLSAKVTESGAQLNFIPIVLPL